jgi:hypothetical protein
MTERSSAGAVEAAGIGAIGRDKGDKSNTLLFATPYFPPLRTLRYF